MGTPKLKKYIAESSCKKEEKRSGPPDADNVRLKKEIENYKALINKKLKDPKFAKKAALILQEMLEQLPKDKDK